MTNSGIRRWLGLAIVPLTLLMLGVASPAFAVPTHRCMDDTNPVGLPYLPTQTSETNPEQGRIEVDVQGDCTFDHDLFATENIQIKATGKIKVTGQRTIRSLDSFIDFEAANGDIDAEDSDFVAARYVRLESGVLGGTATGTIKTKDITSNTEDTSVNDWNILIRAQNDVMVKDVKTNGLLGPGSTRSGAVQIDANLHGDNNGNLAIGGSAANIGTIDVRSVFGGELNTFDVNTGIKITNGSSGSTGNITVADANSLMVQHSASRSGWIELNAQDGDLSIISGNFDVSGMSGNLMGGNVYLLADRITFFGSTKIDASQSDTAPGSARQIILSASAIDYKAAGNLEILSDGNGIDNTNPATIYVLPQGGIISNVATNVLDLKWEVNFNGAFFFLNKPLHFDGGTVGANLKIQADGDGVQIAITGHPIIFDGNDVTIQTKGNHSVAKHEIVMGYLGPATGSGATGIEFRNTGTTEFFVRGEGNNADGGDIQIQTPDKVIVESANLNLKANGPANKPGNGGTIVFTTSEISVSNTTKVKFIADASNGSTGFAQILRNNRKAIFFDAGNSTIPVGKQVKQFSFSAMGGMTGGNGGAIEVKTSGTGSKGIIRVRPQENVVDASARGSQGFGGEIFLNASNKVRFALDPAGPNATKVALKATGGTDTGQGGRVILSETFVIQPQGATTQIPLQTHSLIKVDAGPNEPKTSNQGFILSTGVLCQQKKTDFTTWPKTYWDCDDPINTSTAEQNAVNAAGGLESVGTSTFSGPLNSNKAILSFFKNVSDYNKFADDNGPADQNGLTIAAYDQSHVYTDVTSGLEGHAMHEIGHLIDEYFGDPSQNAFTTTATGTITRLTGAQCVDVYGNANFCVDTQGNPINPWATMQLKFIVGQDDKRELFTFGFQECSGFPVQSTELNTAEASDPEFNLVRDFFNTTFWPGGCRPNLP